MILGFRYRAGPRTCNAVNWSQIESRKRHPTSCVNLSVVFLSFWKTIRRQCLSISKGPFLPDPSSSWFIRQVVSSEASHSAATGGPRDENLRVIEMPRQLPLAYIHVIPKLLRPVPTFQLLRLIIPPSRYERGVPSGLGGARQPTKADLRTEGPRVGLSLVPAATIAACRTTMRVYKLMGQESKLISLQRRGLRIPISERDPPSRYPSVHL
jgi:hypothetical protein